MENYKVIHKASSILKVEGNGMTETFKIHLKSKDHLTKITTNDPGLYDFFIAGQEHQIGVKRVQKTIGEMTKGGKK